MNPIAWLTNLARTVRGTPRHSQAWGGRQAGEMVTVDTALQISAVWACVRVISETIAALPWHVYERVPDRSGRARRERRDGDVPWLLSTQPNPEMTSFSFREALIAHALTWGNGFAEIERTSDGRPSWLWLIPPDRVTVERTRAGGIVYRVNNGSVADTYLEPADVIHLKGLAFDGVTGYSPIAMAARAMGLSLALEKFGSKFFANGAHPGLTITHPGKLSEVAHKNLRDSIKEQISGDNALKPFIMEEGMTAAPMTIPPEEAQFLESRKFQVAEICRWYRVPPHMVADLERATFSNIEHQQIEFVQHTLMPWCRRLEAEIDIKLFKRGMVYSKIELAGLLRGDLKSRYEAYRSATHLSLNDIRELEDMNPVEGGDEYFAQINLAPVDMLRELAEAHVKPEEPAVSADPAPAEDDDEDEPETETPPRAVRAVR